jgi:hypothetical protein
MNKKQRKRARWEEQERRKLENATRPTSSSRPHILTIIIGVAGLFLAGVGLYLNNAQPDIRYVSKLGPETITVVESKMDSAGNFVHNLRMRPTFTNYSFKAGFIDKAELDSQNPLETPSEVKVTSINKTLIHWRQPQRIEITF